MRTLAATTLALLAGAALVASLYWAFLNTPESTVAALALSAVLALAALVLAALTVNLVLLAWDGDTWATGVARRALRSAHAGVLPMLLIAAGWWVALRAEGWVQLRSGEISAWFIAHVGWADVGWLFTSISWLGLWLRWVAAPFAALVWWRQILTGRWLPSGTAIRSAVHPARVALATLIVAALVWAPWTQLVPWRPRAIAPGTSELLFVGAKLGLVVVLSALASALFARAAAAPRG